MKQANKKTSRERKDIFYKSELNDSNNNSLVAIFMAIFIIGFVVFMFFGKNFLK